MKIILTALNAKYIHSNLAIRSLANYCSNTPHSIIIKEFTINDHEHTVLSGIFKEAPDMVCFSYYIWNKNLTLSLVDSLKKTLPHVIIVLGGPEVTDNEADIMEGHPVDIIVTGEGEVPFSMLLDYFAGEIKDLSIIPGITYRDTDNRVTKSMGQSKLIPLDELPNVYEDNIHMLKNKIIYYETSRGCPFSCAYCLSGKESRPRFLSLKRCYVELQFFLDNRVNQVKLIDRTFNCNKAHAMAIWQYLIEHDNGHTNFHFEIAADLLDTEMLTLLETARSGLFQFEIGIQSTHRPTLCAIKRKANLEACFFNIEKLVKMGNIHTHVDLIAGLPLEGFTAFKESFNAVYSLNADHIQLGFLKLLQGSALRQCAAEYGIVYKNAAPYEVLLTADLSYQEIIRLKATEEMLKLYFNSGRYKATLKWVVGLFQSPFDFYEQLADYFEKQGYDQIGHTKWRQYDILYEFLIHNKITDTALIRDLLLFDMYKSELVPNLPGWANLFPSKSEMPAIRDALLRIPGNEQNSLKRRLHVQKFAYDVASFVLDKSTTPRLCDSFTLFDYTGSRSKLGFESLVIPTPNPDDEIGTNNIM